MLKLSKQTILRFVRLHNILGMDLVYLSVSLYAGSVTIVCILFAFGICKIFESMYSQWLLSSVAIIVGYLNYEVLAYFVLDVASSENNFIEIICVLCV